MNIPPNRFPLADAGPSSASAKGQGEYGGGFEEAIRDLQKDQPQRAAARDERPSAKSGQDEAREASPKKGLFPISSAEQAGNDVLVVDAGTQAKVVDITALKAAAIKSATGAETARKEQKEADATNVIRGIDAGPDKKASEGAVSIRNALDAAMKRADLDAGERNPSVEAKETASSSVRDALAGSGEGGTVGEEKSAVADTREQRVTDLLDRLLGASPVAAPNAVAVEPAADALASAGQSDVALEERVVVVSLMPGEVEATDDAAGQARGKVRLEVLHMETHFEPRSDAVVLIEAEDGPVSAFEQPSKTSDDARTDTRGTGQESKLRISFDEALARLGSGQSATSGEGNSRGRDHGDRDDRTDLRAAKPEADRPAARSAQASSAAAFEAGDKTAMALPLASMTDQVAGRIIDALGSSTAATRHSDRPGSETVLRMTAGGAALKTLTIQLQPEHLGVLDVSMRLVEGQLTLELAASEANTAKVLAEDREGLRKLLQHAGFSLEDASITIVTRDATTQTVTRTEGAGNASASQRDDSGSQNSGQGFGGRDARGEEPGRRQDEPDRGRRASAKTVQTRARTASTFL